MRILVATDAWHPQINGVVRSLEQTAATLTALGVETEFLTPQSFRSVPLPTYPEIRLSLVKGSDVPARLDQSAFDTIHIATEGPIGLAARRVCRKRGWVFTTNYHTRFPEYLRARLPIPEDWAYAWLRRFHGGGAATMVATETRRGELRARGSRTSCLSPSRSFSMSADLLSRRTSTPFLGLDLPGTKVLVGDGPERATLQARFSEAVFLGSWVGEDLAAIYASSDVFVFPSRTDTYGIVLLEALASGLLVAAYPVPGPSDVIGRHNVGILDQDLRSTALNALAVPRSSCRAVALVHSWTKSADEFLANIVPLVGTAGRALSTLPGTSGAQPSTTVCTAELLRQ
jgi:hypothetical protein